MKKLLLIPLLMTLPFTAQAQEIDGCVALSTLAESIMSARQSNIDMVQVMEIANSDPNISKVVVLLTKEAYSMPRFSTERIQQETIREFKNDVYLQCLNSRK